MELAGNEISAIGYACSFVIQFTIAFKFSVHKISGVADAFNLIFILPLTMLFAHLEVTFINFIVTFFIVQAESMTKTLAPRTYICITIAVI